MSRNRKEYQREYYLANREKLLARRKEYNKTHRDVINEANRRWRGMHPEQWREANRANGKKQREKVRIDVHTHYGNGKLACVRCGLDDQRALSIDHISGDGAEERKRLGVWGTNFYFLLRRWGYPNGYQTLCMNCQAIKRVEEKEYGYK